jgi:hypothetical protein
MTGLRSAPKVHGYGRRQPAPVPVPGCSTTGRAAPGSVSADQTAAGAIAAGEPILIAFGPAGRDPEGI